MGRNLGMNRRQNKKRKRTMLLLQRQRALLRSKLIKKRPRLWHTKKRTQVQIMWRLKRRHRRTRPTFLLMAQKMPGKNRRLELEAFADDGFVSVASCEAMYTI